MSIRPTSNRPAAATAARHVRLGALSVLLVVALSFTTACGAAGVSLSVRPGTVSVCYRGLPTARDALNDTSAKLTGVHRESYDSLHKRIPSIVMPPGDDDTDVCSFAFTGTFRPGQVVGAAANEQGTVAVVVVSSKKLTLVTSWVGAQLPKNFGARLAA